MLILSYDGQELYRIKSGNKLLGYLYIMSYSQEFEESTQQVRYGTGTWGGADKDDIEEWAVSGDHLGVHVQGGETGVQSWHVKIIFSSYTVRNTIIIIKIWRGNTDISTFIYLFIWYR